ncbi:RNA methyltransferase [Chloroflexi bacterium TSY]|nr:RNA methyltransferase [Chloroflexi bacterium TSY]
MITEPDVHLSLYQCRLKADKFEWVLQKGTELGVARFVPVISERSVVRPAQALLKKYERWNTIIREAAEQSGRGILPELREPLMWHKAVQHAQGIRLLPWEEAAGQSKEPRLGVALQHSIATAKMISALNLMIGPEGGLTVDEIDGARDVGWHVVSLGPRMLRAETAALASVAVVMELSHLS